MNGAAMSLTKPPKGLRGAVSLPHPRAGSGPIPLRRASRCESAVGSTRIDSAPVGRPKPSEGTVEGPLGQGFPIFRNLWKLGPGKKAMRICGYCCRHPDRETPVPK